VGSCFYCFHRKVNDGQWGWRALRLLAKKTPHFFTYGNNPIAKLPDYLDSMLKKMAAGGALTKSTNSSMDVDVKVVWKITNGLAKYQLQLHCVNILNVTSILFAFCDILSFLMMSEHFCFITTYYSQLVPFGFSSTSLFLGTSIYVVANIFSITSAHSKFFVQ
jgi:hypothetical protein